MWRPVRRLGMRLASEKAKRPLRPKEDLLRDATHHDVPVRRRAVKDLGKYQDESTQLVLVLLACVATRLSIFKLSLRFIAPLSRKLALAN